MVDGRGPFGADAGGGAPDGGFGRRPRGGADTLRRIRALAVLLLLVISGLLLRSVWRARSDGPPDALVEVQGAVPDPGIHALPDGASVRQALEAAGAEPGAVLDPFADLPVHNGYRVVLLPDGSTRVWLADERLLVGLPVDPNTADTSLLEQLPGIGPSIARAIVEDRQARGPFTDVDELQRVRGIGPATLESLRPFLGIDGIGGAPDDDQEAIP